MSPETIVEWLIYAHAALGAIALSAGSVAIAARKGSGPHKLSGRVFFYTMIASAITSMVVSLWPDHENPFLFAIAIFSLYFLLSGFLSLRYRLSTSDLRADKLISITTILTGIAMILYPVILLHKVNIVLLVFGLASIIFGGRDMMLYRKPKKLKADWLKLHLGKMTGGYISAVTAFFVVNDVLPDVWNWFTPGAIGGLYIAYWIRKVSPKPS